MVLQRGFAVVELHEGGGGWVFNFKKIDVGESQIGIKKKKPGNPNASESGKKESPNELLQFHNSFDSRFALCQSNPICGSAKCLKKKR